MAQRRANDADGYRRHDDDRLHVGPERNGEQNIDGDDREDEAGQKALHAFGHVRVAALEAVGQSRIVRQQFGQDLGGDGVLDLVVLADRIDVAGDAYRTSPVAAADGRVGAAPGDVRDLAQRHVHARRRADHEMLQVVFARPCLLGKADDHRHLVVASLLAQGLGTVKRRADLSRDVVGGQPEADTLGPQVKRNLLLSRCRSIVDVGHHREFSQAGRQVRARPFQHTDVAVAEFDVQRRARARSTPIGFKLQGFETGDLSDPLAPLAGQGGGADGADIRIGQVDAGLNLVVVNDGPRSFGKFTSSVGRDDRVSGGEQVVAYGNGFFRRAAHGQNGGDDGHIRFRARHQYDAHAAAEGIGQHDGQQRDGRGDDDVTICDAPLQDRPVDAIDEAQQLRRDLLLSRYQEAADWIARFPARIGEMDGKDEQRFDPRHQEHRNHHDRNYPEDLAHESRHEIERDERHDVGNDAETDGDGDVLGTADRGLDERHTPLSVFVDVFARDDGVVDNDAERDDEGEHGHHVDRHVHPRQEQQRAEKGCWNPHRHPESEFEFKERTQQDQHQHQPDETVLHQQVQALPVVFRAIVADGEVHARRKFGLDLGHGAMHGV